MRIKKVGKSSVVGSSLMVMQDDDGPAVAILAVLNAGDRAEEVADFVASLTPPRNASVEGSPLLEWAVSKWNEEVRDRPLVNVHRRSLDDTWRQVIRWAGGDPVELCGPPHDELLRQ